MPLECFPAIHSAFHSYACVVVAVIIIRGFFYMPGNLVSSVFNADSTFEFSERKCRVNNMSLCIIEIWIINSIFI